MNYTALQVKTCYSILNSLCKIDKLISSAKNYGYTSIAITDEDNMFGVMEFYNECKKNSIKPIIGIELSVNDKKILLYAKNNDGYKNLIKLSTIVSEREIEKSDLERYRDNLILVMPFSFYDDDIYEIYEDKFIGYSKKEELDKFSNGVLITNVSYFNKDDYKYLNYAYMIKEGKTLGEYPIDDNQGLYLLKKEEIDSLVDDNVRKNMDYIVNNCNVEICKNNDLLPIYDKNINSQEYLYNLGHKGLNKRLNNNVTDEYLSRLDYELSVINEMGFNDYFLVVYDYVLYAKKNNILVGPGRGSAAGSLVSYSLGITEIDPIKYNLLFERFLNKERVTMPDIDVDFDANRRQEVIDYVTNKYGEKRVVGIITFNTLGAKQVLRDVGRVLDIKQSLIDSVCKLCGKDLINSYKENSNLKKLVDNTYELRKLYNIAMHLEGLPRHISIHAAGVVMSKYDVDETIPLYRNQAGMYLTGYSKDYLEDLGLLKMDFLGIANLTMISEVIESIRNDLNLNITFNNIPMDDKKTIELFKRGDTEGIFQFESLGMINFLKKMRINSFDDIYLALSIYRPGPMESIPEYLKRREKKDSIQYIDPSLKEILEDTSGIIIYQEQIMLIARKMAGYSLGEADILRRAMSKKKEEILIKEKDKFIKGCLKNGYSEDVSEKVYDLILKFANYGFNKSHAVGYAVVAYKMAFLKVHFYSYFMVSLLTSVINDVEKTNTYIAMLRSKNIKVKEPNINISMDNYIVSNKEIICPLAIIRDVGVNLTKIIVKEREKGDFKDLIDFCERLKNTGINRKIIEKLILAGAFREFGYNKKTLINNMDNIMNYIDLVGDNSLIEIEKPILEIYEEYSLEELIQIEFQVFGFYLSNHPVSKYKINEKISTLNLNNYINNYIEIILEVSSIKEIITKKNDVMAFIRCQDEFSNIDLTVFPNLYKDNKELKKYDIIRVLCKVEKRIEKLELIASKITKLN